MADPLDPSYGRMMRLADRLTLWIFAGLLTAVLGVLSRMRRAKPAQAGS